ncbi:hypothetical protein PG984_010507 [Apiospora sp. TS-2023a]
MEALAAVGLAGNILQFVDTTRTLISTTRQISCFGAGEEHLELSDLTRELQAWIERVTPPQVDQSAKLSDEEKSIRSLGEQCNGIANQLLVVLGKLELKSEGTLSQLESFYKALLSYWKKEEVEQLEARLERISSNVQRNLASYDARKIHDQLVQLDKENSRLHAHRGKDIESLGKHFGDIFDDIGKKLEEEQSRDKTMMALLGAASAGSRFAAEQMILEQLWFSAINDRHDSIRDAHSNTMQWVFETSEQHSPATFDEWLTSDDNMYWISGKPGSGKSTLMKFLCDNSQSLEKLCTWAQSDKLVHASYFFWNAGKQKLQKSHGGLLRSLVYQVLRARPDLLPHAYPNTWRLYFPNEDTITIHRPNPNTAGSSISLTVDNLLTVLREVCEAIVDSRSKICFFIDGLDEYYGEPSDMVELTRALRSIPGVKMCLSSREWNEFEFEFGKDRTRKLYMQDFNRGDIDTYVHDTFTKDDNYQDLEDRDTAGKALLDEIVECANGVFLWVYLVVRSFREGLLNGDSIASLKRRLDSLPRDLNEYFERIIFVDVAEFYRGQCAEMFSVTLEGAEDIPLIAYWFIDENDPNHILTMEAKPLSPQQINKRFKATKKRLNACCKGMLEVQKVAPSSEETSLPSSILFNWKVSFLHRTVRDFLLQDETQDVLRRWHSPSFSPHQSICQVILAQIKISPVEPEYWDANDSPIAQLYRIFNYHFKLFEHHLLKHQGQQHALLALRDSLNKTLAVRPIGFSLVKEMHTEPSAESITAEQTHVGEEKSKGRIRRALGKAVGFRKGRKHDNVP